MVTALLATPASASATPVSGDDAAIRAISTNDMDGARAAITSRKAANRVSAFGETLLARAVYTQNPEMVALLLGKGADPDQVDAYGATPLALACEMGNEAIIGLLLSAKADVRRSGPDGATPLAICARFAGPAAVRRILALGAAADSVDTRGQTPLMWAASAGKTETIGLLLDAGADLRRTSKAGFTPLLFAIKSGKTEPVRLLLEKGADVGQRGPENTSAFQLAIYQRNYAAAALLAERGAVDVNERDRHGLQPLHGASAAGDVELARLLLAIGANPNGLSGPSRIKWVTEANFGMPPPPVPPTPPLMVAAEKGHAPVMRLLAAAGAKPQFVAENGANVVHAAAKGGSVEALAYALDLAPDANIADAQGTTPLMTLLFAGADTELEPMLRLFARHGARADLADKQGQSARKIAAGGLTEVKNLFERVFATPLAAAPLQTPDVPHKVARLSQAKP